MAAILALFGALSVAQIVTLIKFIPIAIQVIQILVPITTAGVEDIIAMLQRLHDEFHSHLAIGLQTHQAARAVQSGFPDLFAGKPRPAIIYVHEIQQALNRWDGKPALKVDGKFGPLTREILRQFQISSKLPADGVATVDTLAALAHFMPTPSGA